MIIPWNKPINGLGYDAPISAVTLDRYLYHGWVVQVDGLLQAKLANEGATFWAENPGLRERCLEQIRAERLVGA
jgi:hypothetical protein